jgi:hypothetical protein
MTMLSDLPVGALFSFGAQLTAANQFNLLSKDKQVQATVTIDPNTGALSGQLLVAPNQIPVQVVSAPFNVNDVVTDTNGAAYVVREVWLASTGFCWSNTTNRATVYTTAGFTKVGTATFQ